MADYPLCKVEIESNKEEMVPVNRSPDMKLTRLDAYKEMWVCGYGG